MRFGVVEPAERVVEMKDQKETQWIFRYLRAGRVEIDMGFYNSQEEAQKESNKMASYGALCTPAMEVTKDYKLYKGE